MKEQRKILIRMMPYTLISEELYKICMDEVIRHVTLPHEHDDILRETHDGLAKGHFGGELIRKKVL